MKKRKETQKKKKSEHFYGKRNTKPDSLGVPSDGTDASAETEVTDQTHDEERHPADHVEALPHPNIVSSHTESDFFFVPVSKNKLKYLPPEDERKRRNEATHVYYSRNVCGWVKKSWAEIGDVSEDDQSEVEEGRWDYWKAYYCCDPETSTDSSFNDRFFAWSLLFTLGMNSQQNLIHLMLKHGGGAFLVVLVVVYLGVAYPMYVLETTMGQYGCRKPFVLFRLMAPYLQGLGPALWLRTLLLAIKTLVIAIYAMHYFLDLYICQINRNQLLDKFWARESDNATVLFDLRTIQLGFSYQIKGYFTDYGTSEWMLFLLFLTLFFVIIGLRLFGKVYALAMKGAFLAWTGYLIFSIIRTYGGKLDNIMYQPFYKVFETNWWRMLSGVAWVDAVFYAISSLGLVTLVHPYLASRCYFHYRTARDGIFLIVLNLLWNLIGASAVLLFLGYVTVNEKEMSKALDQIGGLHGIFLTYVMKINQGNLVSNLEYDIEFSCGLYYLLIAPTAILSFHCCLRALIQSSYQEYANLVVVVGVIITMMVILCVGVPFTFISMDGLRLIVHLEFYLHHTFSVVVLAGCFFWGVAYSHNFAKVIYDIRNMVHLSVFRPMGENPMLCAYYPKFYRTIIVLLIFVILLHKIACPFYPIAGGTDYSGNPVILGMLEATLPVLFIIFVGFLACKKGKHPGQTTYRPHRNWYKNWFHVVVCFTSEKFVHRRRITELKEK